MGRPKKYENTTEARQAETARKARYNAENNVQIRVWTPKIYAEKLEYIAQRMNTSKAGVLKMCIDRLYSEMQEDE